MNPKIEASEREAIVELMSMSRSELDLVPYDLVKWVCQGKGCCNGTKIRDYGIGPTYWSNRIKGEWVDISEFFWMCGKHLKMWKHLTKNFSEQHVYSKLMDYDKPRIQTL